MEQLITMSRTDLFSMIEMAADRAVGKMMEATGHVKADRISQRTAFEEFGESFVRRMVKQNQIIGERRGINNTSRINYSRSKLKNLKDAESIVYLIRK